MASHGSQLKFLVYLPLLALLSLINGSDAVQLFPSAAAVPPSIPAACATALSTNITCQELVPAAYISAQRLLDNATLTGLCTPACADSLLAFQAQVDAACGTESYTFSANVNQKVQQIVDPLVWAYNVSCLTDGTSFCLPKVSNASDPIASCSECAWLYGAAMLDSAYGRLRIDPGSFSSTLSSCSVPASKFPYTNPPTTAPAAPTTTTMAPPNAACSGTPYTVQAGDTCDSIAAANDIATDRFLTQNNLDYNCTTLVVGNEVCLGPSCALYQIKVNDTCNGILAGETFYLTQLLSWNPTIHLNCDNLGSMVGRDICISPPGSSTWDVVPENFTTFWNVTFVVPSTNLGTIPPQTATPTYNTTWFVPTARLNISTTTVTVNVTQISAIAALTIYCPITADDYSAGWTIYDLPDNCTDALLEYCNPTVNATMLPSTSFPKTCSPTYYEGNTATASSTTAPLTTAPSTTAPSTTSSSPAAPKQSSNAAKCNALYTVQSGDTCQGIVDKYGNFTLAQFYSWNPAVDSRCLYLKLGYPVCVGIPALTAPSTTVPSPLEPGTDPSCTAYHLVVSGDTCFAIEPVYIITADQFNKWNPNVGTSCGGLWPGYYVCVWAPS